MTGDQYKTQGKHKHGEQGLIEEEENRKVLNMASKDNAEHPDDETNEAQDPSSLELKEMLVDIKIELSKITRDNNKFAKEIVELRSLIQEHKFEIDSLKSSIKLTESKNIALEDQLVAAKEKIDEQKEEIAELCPLQDNLEQYTRKQSLEICGIPGSAYALTEEAVLKIAGALDVTMSAEDINISHKIKRNGAGTILVKFQSHKAKSRLYKASRNRTYIFINENRTSYRKDLLRKANDNRKDRLIISA